MKSYDWGIFLLLLGAVVASVITSVAAGRILFFYALARIAYTAISKKR